MAGEELTTSFDPSELPYGTRSGMRFPKDTAHRLGEYTPPTSFEPGDEASQREDREYGWEHFYGTKLSHHQQQMYAQGWLYDRLGFNSVVVATVNYSDGPKDLYLHANGSWEEVAL